jgi:hypothetical protein
MGSPPATLPRPHVVAVRTATPPTIDGRIDDLVWKAAPPSRPFVQKFPNEAAAPSEPTTFRVLYDDDSLYVAFDCEQRHAGIVPHLSRRDRLVEADRVEIDVGSRHDGKSGFQFSVNAGGVLTDSVLFNDGDSSSDWDENWEAEVSRTENGWSAEFRIPLRVLRFSAAKHQDWDFQARRFISEKQEIDEWAYIPRDAAGEVSHYGTLEDLVDLTPKSPLELKPFVVGEVLRRDAASTQLASGYGARFSAGVDLKWHPTQSLTLDATIHPDFGQVEADQQVLNLTSYETFYPEKRPFFLEGIDTFNTPRQLLYTRRIGRAADAPNLRSDPAYAEQLVELPNPAEIYGALKLTGQIAPKWTLGLLQAATGKNSVDVQLADGTRQSRDIDPLSYFGVARIKRELGRNGHLGLTGTMVARAEDTGAYPIATPYDGGNAPYTQLCPGSDAAGAIFVRPGRRCFNDAYVASLDWSFRTDDREWLSAGQLIGTVLENGPTRNVADGTKIHPGDIGSGAFTYLGKEGGEHWLGFGILEYEGRTLEYDDLGYNQRANDYRLRFGVEWRDMKPWRFLRDRHLRFDYGERWSTDGLPIGTYFGVSQYGTFTNFWNYWTQIFFNPAYYDDREIGDGTALARGNRAGFELSLASNPAKPVSFTSDMSLGWVENGAAISGNAGVLFRALPALDLEVLPTVVVATGEPRYTGYQVANDYVFGRLDAYSIGTVLRATYAFLPRLTLQAYAQLFLASKHYRELSTYSASAPGAHIALGMLSPFTGVLSSNPDVEEGALNINVVLRWEYMLGSTLYLVYTRAQTPSQTLALGDSGTLQLAPVAKAPAVDALSLKLVYFWAR